MLSRRDKFSHNKKRSFRCQFAIGKPVFSFQYSFFRNTPAVTGKDAANAAALQAVIKIPLKMICRDVIFPEYTLLIKELNPIIIPIPPSRLTTIITSLRSSPPRKYSGKKMAQSN